MICCGKQNQENFLLAGAPNRSLPVPFQTQTAFSPAAKGVEQPSIDDLGRSSRHRSLSKPVAGGSGTFVNSEWIEGCPVYCYRFLDLERVLPLPLGAPAYSLMLMTLSGNVLHVNHMLLFFYLVYSTIILELHGAFCYARH